MIGRLYADYLERRGKVQILADIIKVTKKPTKTRILRLANVQYNTFLECMDTLCNAGLLVKISLDYNKPSSKDDRVIYKYQATDMGRKWVESLEEIYRRLGRS